MSLRAQLSCWHETGQPASRWQIVLWDFLKSVVDFKFSGKVLCSFKSFAKLSWYISVNTGKSDSSLYDHRMEEWTVLSICSAPSDLAERVPSAENDDLIYTGIEAYSAVKKKKKLLVKEYVACSFLLWTLSPVEYRSTDCFCSKRLGGTGYKMAEISCSLLKDNVWLQQHVRKAGNGWVR